MNVDQSAHMIVVISNYSQINCQLACLHSCYFLPLLSFNRHNY